MTHIHEFLFHIVLYTLISISLNKYLEVKNWMFQSEGYLCYENEDKPDRLIFLPKDLILPLALPTAQINTQVEFLSNAGTGMAGAQLAAQTTRAVPTGGFRR